MPPVAHQSPIPTSVAAKSNSPTADLCFMETQFPVSKMSKESYSERTSKQSQTLTGLGKWWGRKPLVLCRATILGLLLPSTDDPQMDRDVFLRLMTMDDDGMLRRKSASIPLRIIYDRLPPSDRAEYFDVDSPPEKPKYRKGVDAETKQELQRSVFLSMSYDERLEYCDRPEQIDGPSEESWAIVNAHLGTNASQLTELVAELGKRRFGHIPRVGDSFCGGGSIPFEAARIGCEAYGSDLNPVAALLTWSSMHIIGAGNTVIEHVHEVQGMVLDALDAKVTEWGIEHREPEPSTGRRWRADAYLYCVEVTCPECGWKVPLSPTWVVSDKYNAVVRLIPDPVTRGFIFDVTSNVSQQEMTSAKASGTAKDSELVCPHCLQKHPEQARTPLRVIRGDGRGSFGDSNSLLRPWDNGDVIPRADDIFRERLYCIRWVDRWIELDRHGEPLERVERHFLAPTVADLKREQIVLNLLIDRFDAWQSGGLIPSRRIEPGYNTSQPIRERGWTHWHHLFTPRQLLLLGHIAELSLELAPDANSIAACALGLGRSADYNSRLSRWHTRTIGDKSEQTFSNQALNTLANYAVRSSAAVKESFVLNIAASAICGNGVAIPCDARQVQSQCDFWITDPPYADAVNYEEISEFFLGWYGGAFARLFPDWYADSKRALAVKGSDDGFRAGMVACYRALASQMPDNGAQVVMFTHQDAGVWADLALILWAAGLRVTAAWCIATETQSALKEGNYVQGTVLLVLRRQDVNEPAFLDEVYQDVESEVRRQLDAMLSLDDKDDPNFSDTDYQLAAYAAALRVLTSRRIAEVDVAYELSKKRAKGEVSPVEKIIQDAVRIACDHLVPRKVQPTLWKSLSAMERLYLKGLEMESHGEHRSGVYQELARGFGVDEYRPLTASTKANETRLKTASEFGRKELDAKGLGFEGSLMRHALFGTFKTVETDGTRDAMTWLKTEMKDYGRDRKRLIEVLEFFATLRQNASMEHWYKDAEAAHTLAGALINDNV
jgi:putative DNA methylase